MNGDEMEEDLDARLAEHRAHEEALEKWNEHIETVKRGRDCGTCDLCELDDHRPDRLGMRMKAVSWERLGEIFVLEEMRKGARLKETTREVAREMGRIIPVMIMDLEGTPVEIYGPEELKDA
jgi:hypothetical protein